MASLKVITRKLKQQVDAVAETAQEVVMHCVSTGFCDDCGFRDWTFCEENIENLMRLARRIKDAYEESN